MGETNVLFSIGPLEVTGAVVTMWVIIAVLALLSWLATRRLRHVRTKGLPLAAAVPPVLINAVVVGLEVTYIFMPETASLPVLLFNMLTVGIGQAVCAGGLGLVLVRTVEKSPLLKQWFEE